MELHDVLDVYVEYVVALYCENGVLDIVVLHVDSCRIGAPKVIYVWLVFYVYAGRYVVSC